MGFTPDTVPVGSVAVLDDLSSKSWTPLFSHSCSFPPEIFREVMMNVVRNPNLNSNHLFRADISLECPFNGGDIPSTSDIPPRLAHFAHFDIETIVVRTMIPRNMLVDKPLDQTCLFYRKDKGSGEILSLVVYLPHILDPSESPFYHPAVHGIAFLHGYDFSTSVGNISIHYCFFDSEPRTTKLERTALHLLAVLHKHGEGTASGYVKRVHHDQVLPQATVQNTYARLKAKYARNLVEAWVETTDPAKHVFEDLGIAAFLIELWAEMFKDGKFPGFVDIGCGNGLLVHILLEEGYSGWGFDARKRKSWSTYAQNAQDSLREMVLIPSIVCAKVTSTESPGEHPSGAKSVPESNLFQDVGIHDGLFPKGTFIVSNHADELTAWTPLLATLSECPFMMIPCCSHDLGGARFRAPSVGFSGPPPSAYASLVEWTTELATNCGWEVEKEMLRIPSTRNTALIGRHRSTPFDSVKILGLIQANGGAAGWEDNALKLVKGSTRGH